MRFVPQILLPFLLFTGSPAFAQIPVTVLDIAGTSEDIPVQIAVLANDFDLFNTIVPATLDVDPSLAGIQSSVVLSGGTFVAAPDGLVTFTPALNTSGVVLHSYTVNNELGVTSLPGAITVTVTAVNDLPIATDDATATTEDSPVSINVTANDTDVEGPVNVASVDLDPVSGGRQVSVSVTEGSFAVDNAGVVTYTPALNFSGVVTQQYTVEDNAGGVSAIATLTVTVSAVNDIPVANNDAGTTNEDTPVSLNITANDTDAEGALVPASVDLNTGSAGIQHTITTLEGMFVFDGTSTVTFTPAANINGTATVNYTIADGLGAISAPATISITVTAVNDPPVAVPDAITTGEGVAVTLNVVANDTDTENNISAASVDLDTGTPGIQGSNTTSAGSWSVNNTGVVLFTPLPTFNGDATISYTVDDTGGATSNAATITVTVEAMNDPPEANPDATSTGEELTVMLNVVANDTDEDGTVDAATVDLNMGAVGIQNSIITTDGSYSVTSLGVVTFSPASDFNGVAVLPYTVNDNDGATSNQANITITVTDTNDPPVASADVATTNEEVVITINVVSNDTDTDGTVDAATVDLDVSTAGIQNSHTTTAGAFTVNSSGVVTFTPALNFSGPATLSYTVNDDDGATSNAATINITVTAVNDPPVAVADATTTDEETLVTLNVVTNDTDIDGTINASTVDLDVSTGGIQNAITTASGTYSVSAAGVVTFTPGLNFTGPALLNYTVNDNSGATSNQGTITITVNATNDPPVAVNDATSTNEEAAVTINVASNDTDPDGTVNAATVDLNTAVAGIQNTNTTTAGTYTVNAAGEVTFTPALNVTGPAVLTYTINDNNGATSNQATITITVNPVNDPPVAVNDATTTNEGTPVTLNITANDTDFDGTVNASTVDLNTGLAGIQTTNTTAGGSFTVNAGTITFTPLASFNGSTSLLYTVQDNLGATSNTATITITVNAVNDPPVANNDAAATNEDTPVTFNIVANDTDEDGTVNAASVDLNTALAGIQATNTTAAGTFAVNPTGEMTYTPVLNFTGPATLSYRVNDNEGAASNAATITVTVSAVNDAPVANNDAASVNEDQSVTVNVVANDTDADGTINTSTVDLNLSTAGVQNTATISGGTVSVSGAGVVTFTPAVNFYGITTTQYMVNDNAGATSNAATITFTVTAVNDPPIAGNDIISADENETVAVNVITNDIDIDGTINPATVDLNPASPGIQITRTVAGQGTFTVAAGLVTFVPVINFNGIASITYTVQDDAGGVSNAATITVTVNSVNSQPVAADDAATTNEDVAITVKVVSNDADPDGSINAATVDLNTGSAGIQNSITTITGTFAVNSAGEVTFTPIANFNGPASITYTVNDNVGATSNTANLVITVTSVNDLPVANNDAATTTESAAVVINVVTNDTDVDGTIDAATVDLNTALAGIQATNTIAAGTFTASATGDVTFTPTGTFSGTATLGYRVNDNAGGVSNTATISVTVTAVNDPPVAADDAAVTSEDIAVNVNVVSNDIDEDGTINPASVDLNTASAGIQNSNATTSGTFTVNAAGIVTFTPAANFTGTVSVDYTVNDNLGLTSNAATLTITVNPVNDAPVAVNDAVSTNEDTPVVFNIVSNDTDPDGTINASSVDLNTTTAGIQNANTSTGGSFTVNAQGEVTFTPNANFSGATTLNYRVNDNLGATSNTVVITVTVIPVNDPPVFAEIADQRVLQNSGAKSVAITGISPGPLESEQLLISATSGNTALIPHPTIVYNGTAATATLSFTPAAGQSGVADVTVKIVDTGLNEFTRSFQIEVLEVNIISQPTTVTAPLQLYTYNIALTANLPETLTIAATQKPAWLTLSSTGVNMARLQGTPPANALHLNPITLQVKSGANVLDEQSYTLVVNRAPTVSTFSFVVNEDVPTNFAQQDFADAFSDADNNTLAAIKIVTLPETGTLRVNGAAVAVGQEISFVSIPNLSYLSDEDFVGSDTFTWTGSDGFAYSAANASVNITINPVNDGPRITNIETDSLLYDLGSDENVVLTPLFDAIDIDDTMLAGATIGFRPENFRPGNDELIFFNTSTITGVFDELSGILTLTGIATIEEYIAAIRNINYRFNDFSEIIRETKSVYFTLTDGKTPGETRERYISLIYTFEPLNIPNAFTPGGNDVNEVWKVTDPDGTGFEQYSNATIQVYTKRGTLVYEATGLDKGWDGTLNGEILPADTYYYIIDLKYNKIVYKGVVLILR